MLRLLIPGLLLLLAACSSQDESGVSETPEDQPKVAQEASGGEPAADRPPIEELSAEDLQALARDPDALREVMRDPEQREAVRDRLRELRQARRGDADATDRRQAMRERAEQFRESRGQGESDGAERRRGRLVRWWENEVVARDIGLSEEQVAEIGQAHDQVVGAARQARQQLAEASSAMQDALKGADRERLGQLVQSRFEALEARARAEAEWMRSLLEILSDEQLRELAEERPELVGALLAPVR